MPRIAVLVALGVAAAVVLPATPVRAQVQVPTPVVPTIVPSVVLPPALDRVLRDYERAWQAKDAAGLAKLFTDDGMTLSNGRAWQRGRLGIEKGYASAGGPLSLRAVSYAIGDTVGYIIGAFAPRPGETDAGKFVLALRKTRDGVWRIAADIDNGNEPRRPPPSP